jgi:hypothetical protein
MPRLAVLLLLLAAPAPPAAARRQRLAITSPQVAFGAQPVAVESGFPVSTAGGAGTSVTSPDFATAGASLLAAFVAGNASASFDSTLPAGGVTGAGLTWTRAVGGGGIFDVDVEVWLAAAPSARGAGTCGGTCAVTASWGANSVSQPTIMVFSLLNAGASPVGATVARAVNGTDLSVSATMVAAGSLFFGLGFNPTIFNEALSPGANTTLHQGANPPGTFQVIRTTAATANAGDGRTVSSTGYTGGTVTYCGVELRP